MKLPQRDKVIISKEKLLDYVLSQTHATGKFKARFFRSLGFNESNIKLFENTLRQIANTNEIKDIVISSYGTKYITEANIDTPNGKIIKVRVVWIIENDKNNPRFITIYPV